LKRRLTNEPRQAHPETIGRARNLPALAVAQRDGNDAPHSVLRPVAQNINAAPRFPLNHAL